MKGRAPHLHQHQGQTWPSTGSRRAPSPPPATQQTCMLLQERQITFTQARGSPGSAPLPGGGWPSAQRSAGGRTFGPPGWRLGLCGPSPVPQVGPNKPCVVCRESFPPGSLGLPSALSGLFLVFKSWNPSAQIGARQYHTPDARRTPPPGTGGRRSSQGPQISALTDFRGQGGGLGAMRGSGQAPWTQTPAGQDPGAAHSHSEVLLPYLQRGDSRG